jgi:hypothetical protein
MKLVAELTRKIGFQLAYFKPKSSTMLSEKPMDFLLLHAIIS